MTIKTLKFCWGIVEITKNCILIFEIIVLSVITIYLFKLIIQLLSLGG